MWTLDLDPVPPPATNGSLVDDGADTRGRKYARQLLTSSGAHESLRSGAIEEHRSSASTSTISRRLGELEEAGLGSRTQYNEIPPRVEYSLTDDGGEVRTRLGPLLEWTSTGE